MIGLGDKIFEAPVLYWEYTGKLLGLTLE